MWWLVAALGSFFATAALADDGVVEVHGQATYVRQLKPTMPSAYTGPNSLRAEHEWAYTFTSTVFFGVRHDDTEIYFNPEFVQGVPLSGLHGLGGFTNGEAQRGAGPTLKGYQARLFARQTWNLGGEWEESSSDQNQVKTRHAAERLVLTAGNLSVLDVFDPMDYSRDPRTQFMNWSSLTYGAWDYPADARGYTWGAALEYIRPGWRVRAGRFLVPEESNGLRLERSFRQRFGDVVEAELPYRFAGRAAVARALIFRNRVDAGAFNDALDQRPAGGVPDVSTVRKDQQKRGLGIETQVQLDEHAGAYVRAGWSDGMTESFMFTEIDRSLAAGTLLQGAAWGRVGDQAGIALYVNGLSSEHRDYLSAGGSGFFLGDGRLTYGPERIVETFYSLGTGKTASVTLDWQRVEHPGYNRDRGPAAIISLRFHAEI